MRVLRKFFGFLLILILTSPFCGAETRSISVGGIFDLTSPAGSVWGNDERDGFILAIEDFQKSNPDFRVTYHIEDSAYSNTRSVSALQKLTGTNKTKFVVGPTWETFVAISPICERGRVICFATSNHGTIFHDPKNKLRYSFTAYFDEYGYATKLADKMIEEGRKRIAAFSAISAYYDMVAQVFFDRFKEKPLVNDRFESEIKDFRALITKTPKDLDALF